MDAHRRGRRARAGDRGGRLFLPNLVAARLDRTDQDTAFSLSTGDAQGAASILRQKLTDGMQNLFYGAEDPVELDESAAAHTLAEMTQYAQDLLGALERTVRCSAAAFPWRRARPSSTRATATASSSGASR